MQRHAILVCLIGMITCLAISAMAQERARSASSTAATASATTDEHASATHSPSNSPTATDKDKASAESALRIEGEKRFRTNCGRCHTAPHKFAPRVMATAIRHMRVRAMLTDEDMLLILHYMTQ
jgi:cytochrome c5